MSEGEAEGIHPAAKSLHTQSVLKDALQSLTVHGLVNVDYVWQLVHL